MKEQHFTIYLKMDYYHSPDEDAILTKDKNSTQPGSFWQWYVVKIEDGKSTEIPLRTLLQRESMVKNGGLKRLISDMENFLPRYLDENGLPSK